MSSGRRWWGRLGRSLGLGWLRLRSRFGFGRCWGWGWAIIREVPISSENTFTERSEEFKETTGQIETTEGASRTLEAFRSQVGNRRRGKKERTSSVMVAVVCLLPIFMTIVLKQ